MTAADLPGTRRVLAALHRPATLADLAAASGRSIAEAARILLSLIRNGGAVAYCLDHFIQPGAFLDHYDEPTRKDCSASRRVMAALTQTSSAAELAERTGLAEAEVRSAIFSLTRLDAVASVDAEGKHWRRTEGTTARGSRQRRIEHMAAKAAAMMLLDVPRTSGEIAKTIGYSAAVMNDLVQDLMHSGKVLRVERSRYVRSLTPRVSCLRTLPSQRRADGQRLQPVRDAILESLSEPRQAVEIARVVERTVPNVTGHLRAMLRRGLVERIAYGRYARPGTPGLPPAGERCFVRPGTPLSRSASEVGQKGFPATI
ncbi:Transcriptional regulator, ArsR family (plasmid) [Roseomonas mucosa]|uniref:helix-turn-helix domain-containing protein n=1 Tax=Roseomonas mucosa TaxID=207340 RepID=UPI0024CB46C1|nr:helix-turn-helix domain-containing protein [Roseomonas mucosa]QDD92857.1 Transcriptional regulator, ArsR family [Roseomonas mucosa]